MDAPIDITARQVRQWLEQHPDFLRENADLLPDHGKVMTLESGRMAHLSRQSARLQDQLDQVLARIRQNEDIYNAFHGIKLRLIRATDPATLVREATHSLESLFRVARATIALSDRVAGVERLRQALGPGLRDHLLPIPHDKLAVTLPRERHAVIRIGLEGTHRTLFFGPAASAIRCEVLVPLAVDGELMGSLNLGDGQPSRFLPSQSTDLVQDLADILALCLKNLLAAG